MSIAPSRARRTALRLLAAAAIAGTLAACDTAAPVAPTLDASPSLQHNTESDSTSGGSKSGYTNPNG